VGSNVPPARAAGGTHSSAGRVRFPASVRAAVPPGMAMPADLGENRRAPKVERRAWTCAALGICGDECAPPLGVSRSDGAPLSVVAGGNPRLRPGGHRGGGDALADLCLDRSPPRQDRVHPPHAHEAPRSGAVGAEATAPAAPGISKVLVLASLGSCPVARAGTPKPRPSRGTSPPLAGVALDGRHEAESMPSPLSGRPPETRDGIATGTTQCRVWSTAKAPPYRGNGAVCPPRRVLPDARRLPHAPAGVALCHAALDSQQGGAFFSGPVKTDRTSWWGRPRHGHPRRGGVGVPVAPGPVPAGNPRGRRAPL
jgi:hypothetical protein